MKNQKKTIALTKKQFKALLKTVYLGNWMANAFRVHDKAEDYENTEDLIFSFAAEFGFPEYLNHEESDGKKYFPTALFEDTTDVHDRHAEYDDEIFWDELINRFAEQDIHKTYSKKEISEMDEKEYMETMNAFLMKYAAEFAEHGIERLKIEQTRYN